MLWKAAKPFALSLGEEPNRHRLSPCHGGASLSTMQHYSAISRDSPTPWPCLFNIRCGHNPTERVFCWIMKPQATLKPSRRQDRLIPVLTQEEVRHLFAVITNKRDSALVHVAYRHGLRAS